MTMCPLRHRPLTLRAVVAWLPSLAVIGMVPARAQDLHPESPPPASAVIGSALGAVTGLKVSGLVLLSEPSQVRAQGWPDALDAQRLDTRRVPLVANDVQAQAELVKLIGEPYSDGTLRSLRAVLQAAHARASRPFVVISLPPQDVTGGVLQILVTEGRLGQVTVTGNQHFSEGSYLGAMRSRVGEPISTSVLDEDLAWLGENPFRSATVTAQPGAQPGQTDLVLSAQDRRPWRVYAGIDNTGTTTTGRNRYQLGLNHGNLWGLGHQLGLQRTASPDNKGLVSHAVTYLAPLPWRHTLLLAANRSTIHSQLPEPFDQSGINAGASIKYRVPLGTRGGARQSLVAGLDYKRTDNNLLFAEIPVTNNRTDIYQWSLAWDGQRPDDMGHTGWGLTWVHSPGGRGAYNQDLAFALSRAGASSRYSYVNLNISRSTRLGDSLTLANNLAWQSSNRNLLGTEQVQASGAYAVRGFAENAVYADQGFVLRNELRLNPVKGLSRWISGLPGDQVQWLTFIDWARVRPHLVVGTEPEVTTLASVGLGLRCTMGQQASLRLDWARPIKYSRGDKPGPRWHLGFNISF